MLVPEKIERREGGLENGNKQGLWGTFVCSWHWLCAEFYSVTQSGVGADCPATTVAD
jgi:hypothetical protein